MKCEIRGRSQGSSIVFRERNFSIKVQTTIAIQDLLPDAHLLLMTCFRPRGGTMFSDSVYEEVAEEDYRICL